MDAVTEAIWTLAIDRLARGKGGAADVVHVCAIVERVSGSNMPIGFADWLSAADLRGDETPEELADMFRDAVQKARELTEGGEAE